MHHYIKVIVKPDYVTFDVVPIFSKWAKFFYMYVDEPYTYTYSYVANNFAWLIACLAVALGGAVAGMLLIRRSIRRRREAGATPDRSV